MVTKTAIAHDYLAQRGGAERVALVLSKLLPKAPIYTSIYLPNRTYPEFKAADIRTSFLQNIPTLREHPRRAAPLMPLSWRTNQIDDAEIVIASSSGWAHAASGATSDVPVIVYCHNPARWVYQAPDYIQSQALRAAYRPIQMALRRWDTRKAAAASTYIVNSSIVADRVREAYNIDPWVLHPPIGLDPHGSSAQPDGIEPGFWMTVARGRGYKNVDAVIEGILKSSDGELVVVGQSPPNSDTYGGRVKWTGVVSESELRWLYANARALVSVSREDFGLTPLEANAFGTPAVVLRAGGFLDSLDEGVSGVYVEEPTSDGVARALASLPDIPAAEVLSHAKKFSVEEFARRLSKIVLETTGVDLRHDMSAQNGRRPENGGLEYAG